MELFDKTRAGSGFWSLTDQAIVSLGNFLTNILLARELAPKEYGGYAILLGVLLVIYGTHGAIVTYPLSLLGASESQDSLRSLTVFSVWLTTGIGLVLGAGLMIGCWAFARPSLGPWAAGAIFFWIIQETVRRGLMAHMRFRGAIWGDAISYFGQAAVVFVLARVGRLSIESAFGAMAATSLIAASLQCAQLGIRSSRVPEARVLLERFWNLGRWMVLSNFTGIFSMQFFPWALAVLRGAPLAGAFQALSNVVAVTNPICVSVANLIIPASAKTSSQRGPRAALHEAVRYGSQGAFFVLPCLALVLLWPHRILSILYGRESSYASLATALCILAATQFVYYVAIVLASLLNALGHSRATFFILVVSALVSIMVGIPLIIWKGLLGAVVTMALGVLVRAVLVWLVAQRQSFGHRTHRLQYQEIA